MKKLLIMASLFWPQKNSGGPPISILNLVQSLKDRFDIKPLLDVDDGIITSSRTKDGVEYKIAVNMKERPVKVRLDHEMYDVLNDRTVSGEIELAGYDTLFVCDK